MKIFMKIYAFLQVRSYDYNYKLYPSNVKIVGYILGQQDFDNRTHTLGFYGSTMCRRAQIDIINDNINEADEEVFNIQLTLSYSLNPNLITFSRNASLGVILDDDRKSGKLIIHKLMHCSTILLAIRIGFVKPNYTFTEPPVDMKIFFIPLIKEDGRVSQQTFNLQIDVSNMTNRFQPATSGDDYEHEISNIIILPDQQTVMWEFKLISNEIAEENEAFRVSISSFGHPKFLNDNNNVFNTTTIVINDPKSWFD